MARRKKRTRKERARLFELHDRMCHLCGRRIHLDQAWQIDHVVEWHLTHDDSDENCQPAHEDCHRAKSAARAKTLAKVERQRQKHLGARNDSTFWKPKGVKFDWKRGRYTRQ